jgi:hypothetical protein
MGEKLTPSRSEGYLIIKPLTEADYNYWKSASDYGILRTICLYIDSRALTITASTKLRFVPILFCCLQLELQLRPLAVRMRRSGPEVSNFDPERPAAARVSFSPGLCNSIVVCNADDPRTSALGSTISISSPVDCHFWSQTIS